MSRVTLLSPFGKGALSVADDKAAERYIAAGWTKQKATSRTRSAKPSDKSDES